MSDVVDINGKDDELYQDAVDIVRGYDKAAISFLQRELRIGYNRAARLMTALEANKVVTPFGLDGTRTVIYDDIEQDGWEKIDPNTPAKDIIKKASPKKKVVKKASPKKAQKKSVKKQAKKPTQQPIKNQKETSENSSTVKQSPKKKQKPKVTEESKKALAKENRAKAKLKKLGPIPKYHINHQEWNKLEVVELICQDLIKTSYGLNYICRHNDDYPTQASVFSWFNQEDMAGGDKPLLDMYARAKRLQADYVVDEMHEIADDGKNDYMEKVSKDGEIYEALNPEAINRSRLRIDTRKWTASKLNNRKYGDKLELAGSEERPLSKLSDEELGAKIAALQKSIEGIQGNE